MPMIPSTVRTDPNILLMFIFCYLELNNDLFLIGLFTQGHSDHIAAIIISKSAVIKIWRLDPGDIVS